MPFVLRDQAVLLLALVVVLPLQYYYSIRLSSKSLFEKNDVTSRQSTIWARVRKWYEEVNEWMDEVLHVNDEDNPFFTFEEPYDEELDEDDDFELMGQSQLALQFKLTFDNGIEITNISDSGWFGTSTKSRRKRPPNITFQLEYFVGDVVIYVPMAIACVITGWDPVARAPEVWISESYGDERDEFALQPHYTVICDNANSAADEMHYFPQSELAYPDQAAEALEEYLVTSLQNLYNEEDLQSIVGQIFESVSLSQKGRLDSHMTHRFFSAFNDESGKYQMRPWLRRIYPKDQERL